MTPAPAMDQGILHRLKDMSQEDRRTFYRWLKANAVIGFTFAAALMAMVLIGSDLARPDEAAVAINTNGSEGPVTGAAAIAGAHADEATEPLYPGRHIANCKPTPIVGCLCETDIGHASIFPPSDASDPAEPKRDGEYSQMVQWLRLTCQTIRR
jgi:hypothetical protein